MAKTNMNIHKKTIIIDGRRCKLCRYCGQPMRPKGARKKPDEWDHAQGCPYARKWERQPKEQS